MDQHHHQQQQQQHHHHHQQQQQQHHHHQHDAAGAGAGNNEGERWTGRGRGRGSRFVEQEPLRRPHQQGHAPGNNISDIVRNSVLSADAAEFVPKSFAMPGNTPAGPPMRSSVQDRIQIARQAQNVQQVMMQRQQHQHQYNWHQSGNYHHQQQQQQQQYAPYHYNQQYPVIQDYGQFVPGSGDYIDKHLDEGPVDLAGCLVQLENAMRTLTMNPGKFDSLVSHLVDTISPFLDQTSQCEEIFNLIIQQSVNEGNFRYSGARLCVHLDTVDAVAGTTEKPTAIFRETLINQCKRKTEDQSETWRQITKHTDDDEKKCHGLIFFLAELVTQMESEPASELGKLLIRLINTVLQNPAPTSAKNICQALKLAGQTLERDNSGNRSEMEQVMRTLSDLVIQGRVDSHVGRMVTSVSELRSGNWGVSSHPPVNVESKETSSSQIVDEPIFYGPDGEIITDEESRFLEDLAEQDISSQEPWENDEEDDMIAEAFEEFLKLSQNNNKENEKNVQTRNSNEH